MGHGPSRKIAERVFLMEYVAALPAPRQYTPGISGRLTLPAVGFNLVLSMDSL